MAGVKEMMGSSILERPSLISSTNKLFNNKRRSSRCPSISFKRVSFRPLATVSEDYYLINASQPSDLRFNNNNHDDSGDAKLTVRAVVTVRNKIKEDLKEALVKQFDNLAEKVGRNIVLQLVSTDIDPRARGPKKSGEAVLKDWSKKSKLKAERVNYLAEFVVDSNFGVPGAILITNNHQQEFFLESITIEGFACGPVHFPCNSWVQSYKDLQGKRIFFHNKPYLPHETPAGLRALRQKELKEIRGDGKGERKMSDRIYDYDVYNDLGNPDKGSEYRRPLLGGQEIPYPRRCRTGRPPMETEDKLAWMRDDEFARQFLAGVNPASIERMQSFPPVSKLNPRTHGSVESALKEEHIVGYLDGMSVQEALDANRLFIVDYHDIYLPFLERLNALDGRKSYATRTVFFLTSLGTLKPIAIELSLPPSGPNSKSKRVVTPPVDATTNWIWQLAKAHVCANDAGVHQLVHHWLRTHASLEPFILSAHRQLSYMHPIYKLLEPHMRYTLHINALARQSLINGDGVIEACFTPGRYSMDISAAAYKDWRFDLEGLPSDLIRRGIAVPDSTQPHGLRLLLEDYPYAADGLLIWDAIENWVRGYVNHYYEDPNLVAEDRELQAWYYEAVHVGHADVSDASWWPELNTTDDLVNIITTLVWLASAQHAALNFGQYPYGGYVPNRPVLMRRLIPDENDPEYASFLSDPQKFYLSALPSVLQTSKFIAVIDTLSTHSPDEEYLGERTQPSTWTGDPEIVEKFFEFSSEIRRIEKEIDRRNSDPGLRNRCGAGVIPYELMAPSSEPGVTCRGVPNSITI